MRCVFNISAMNSLPNRFIYLIIIVFDQNNALSKHRSAYIIQIMGDHKWMNPCKNCIAMCLIDVIYNVYRQRNDEISLYENNLSPLRKHG